MNFNRKAPQYNRYAVVQREVADALAEWIDEDVASLSALELGAGTGLLTRHLAARGFKSLEATDIAPGMVEIGKAAVPGANWSIADAWNPEPRKADRLYSSSLLQWADEPEAILRKWRSLLQPGGKAVIAFFIEGSIVELERAEPGFSAVQWRDVSEWERIFAAAGFDIVRSSVSSMSSRFPTAADAIRSLNGIGAATPNRAGASALRSMMDRLEKEYSSENGIPLSWKALLLEAESGR